MKLKADEIIDITKEELRNLLKALHFTHEDAGNLCGLTPFAISRWRTNGNIPKTHLIRLGQELAKRLEGIPANELKPIQVEAKKLIESRLSIPIPVLDAIGTTKPSSLLPLHEKMLSTATTQELLQELLRRSLS